MTSPRVAGWASRRRRILGTLAVAALVLGLVVACGSKKEEESQAVDYEKIRTTVQETVKASVTVPQSTGPTAAEIKGIVETAVAAATVPGATREEVESVVSKALSEALASVPEGVTAEDVAAAIASIKPPEGVTAAQIEEIVASSLEMAMSPAPREEISGIPVSLQSGAPNFSFFMDRRDDFWTGLFGDKTDFQIHDILGKGLPVVLSFTSRT